MNGVMMPSVSAGSSQREASVMCTPHVIVPSGAASTSPATPRTRTTASRRTTARQGNDRMGFLQARIGSERTANYELTGQRKSTLLSPCAVMLTLLVSVLPSEVALIVYVPGGSLARRIGPSIVASSTCSFLADSIPILTSAR